MALEIRHRRVGAGERAVEIIDVIGRLDTPGSAVFRATVQEILKEGCPRIAVNLAECLEIHREMMGTFHSLGRACIRAGGGLVLFAPAGVVLEYVKKTGDRNLAPFRPDEKSAIAALGGQVEPEPAEVPERASEPPVVVALGSDAVFRTLFWKLSVLGGRAVAKFDTIEACSQYLPKRKVHSVLIDASLPVHALAGFIRDVRTTPQLKDLGLFVVGAPSKRGTGRTLVDEGANTFIPYTFTGEEIAAKLDARTFFARLKEVYERFDARAKAKEKS